MDLRGVSGGVGTGRRVDESDVYTTQVWNAKEIQNPNKCFEKINNLMLKIYVKKIQHSWNNLEKWLQSLIIYSAWA